jgi:uncharacterized membrane protein
MISFPLLMLLAFIFGGIFGAIIAKIRGGARKDLMHYFFVWGVIAFIIMTVGGTLAAR